MLIPSDIWRRPRVCLLIAAAIVLAACGSSGPVEPAPSTTGPAPTIGPPSTTSSVAPTTSPALDPATTTSHPDRVLPGELIVLGDWGSGTLPEGAVSGAIERHLADSDADAILTTGDNFYSDDVEFLLGPYEWALQEGIPWWITWGNHDVESQQRIDLVNETFQNPPRWTTHEWGGIDVIILDSNQVDSLAQAAYFLDAMQSSDRPTIVVLHHPPYSCSHHGSTIDVVNQMVQILDDDVVLVLSGHDHNYQRFENSGVSYVVTGGGGRRLYDVNTCPPNHPPLVAGEAIHHFLALRQTDEAVEVSAIDVNGDVFDSFSIELD